MKKFFLYLILLILSVNIVSAQCAVFFYGQGCPHCGKVEPFLDQVELKYPDLEIRRYEVYNDQQNLQLLNKYFESYGMSIYEQGVPVIFIGNKYLAGDTPIINNFENLVKKSEGVKCPEGLALPDNHVSGETGDVSPTKKLEALSWITVIGAAIVDSINPCAIAVLLILISGLLVSENKKRALKAGLAFTLSIYIIYFLFGLGLFSALQYSGLATLFYKIIGVIAILIGLANIKDYFWYGGAGFVMEIPRKWRPTLKKLLHSVTSPLGAFLIGFVVCLFELPCTGGPYIFILGLLAEKATRTAAIPILLVYNLFFILPLILITLLLYVGKATVESTTRWKDANIRILHLIAGIVMTLLGLMVLFGWV